MLRTRQSINDDDDAIAEEEEEEFFALVDTDNDAPHQAKYLQPRVLGTDFDFDFNRCIELGWWFHFPIALFGVLFVAVVGLVVDSDFFSPRLWLSNGC